MHVDCVTQHGRKCQRFSTLAWCSDTEWTRYHMSEPDTKWVNQIPNEWPDTKWMNQTPNQRTIHWASEPDTKQMNQMPNWVKQIPCDQALSERTKGKVCEGEGKVVLQVMRAMLTWTQHAHICHWRPAHRPQCPWEGTSCWEKGVDASSPADETAPSHCPWALGGSSGCWNAQAVWDRSLAGCGEGRGMAHPEEGSQGHWAGGTWTRWHQRLRAPYWVLSSSIVQTRCAGRLSTQDNRRGLCQSGLEIDAVLPSTISIRILNRPTVTHLTACTCWCSLWSMI